MSFISFLSVILDQKSVDLIKIIEFQSQEIAVLKAMNKEGRKYANITEKRLLGTLAHEIRHILKLGKIETIFKPETILKWYRQFANAKFDGSKNRKPKVGRPETDPETVKLIIKIAQENKTWGADRIVGALKNLGIQISDQTVLNTLQKNGIPIAPDRKKEKNWKEFIRLHTNQLWACDFFLVPVLTLMGVRHFHVFVFIQYCTRQIKVVGVKDTPNGAWMEQMAKNITDHFEPMLPNCKYLVHDRDTLYTQKFEQILKDFGITPVKTPPQSPNLNPFIERFNRSIKYECLNNMIIFGEKNLRKFLEEYAEHYHFERKTKPRRRSLAGLPSPFTFKLIWASTRMYEATHQGIGNEIIKTEDVLIHSQKGEGDIIKKERIGGLLNYYYRKSA